MNPQGCLGVNCQEVTHEMEWLKALLQAYGGPQQDLENFMETYSQAVDKQINAQEEPTNAWLKKQAQSLR